MLGPVSISIQKVIYEHSLSFPQSKSDNPSSYRENTSLSSSTVNNNKELSSANNLASSSSSFIQTNSSLANSTSLSGSGETAPSRTGSAIQPNNTTLGNSVSGTASAANYTVTLLGSAFYSNNPISPRNVVNYTTSYDHIYNNYPSNDRDYPNNPLSSSFIKHQTSSQENNNNLEQQQQENNFNVFVTTGNMTSSALSHSSLSQPEPGSGIQGITHPASSSSSSTSSSSATPLHSQPLNSSSLNLNKIESNSKDSKQMNPPLVVVI